VTERPGRAKNHPFPKLSVALYAAIPLGIVTLASGSILVTPRGILEFLPTASVDVFYSFLRMVSAYALSFVFALTYGYYASAHRGGERVMIPVLDILQSVPILGFFPVVIVLLAGLTPNSFIGPNLASVVLIFTSMAWNMVFGVYESLKTLPTDLKEAADTFHLRGWLRFRRVMFPATINRLVYNSVLSWTGGWFFLVEAEIFTTNGHGLPGIGSFLSFSAAGGNANAFAAGLVMLVLVIVLLDVVVWRPLGHWAEKFRYDQTPSGEGEVVMNRDQAGRIRRAASFVTRGVRTGVTRISTPFVQLAAIRIRPTRRPTSSVRPWVSTLVLGAILVIVWLMLIAIVVAIYQVFTGPIPASVRVQILHVPFAMGASVARVAIAYLLCLAIALPLAVVVARRSLAARAGLPVIEVVASFPATALFPVIIFGLTPYLSQQGVAILMLMTGMIWYLFFNLLAGARSLAPDLEEASRAFGLKGRGFLRRVLLPSLFPALVTGSVTAFGGGWNTLIVAEYLNVGTSPALNVLGIGQTIDIGYAEAHGIPLMVTALLTLVATVIAINELLWKPLYRRAAERFRYD
jgi:NitT/TauT family transport system permease protein